jgi:HK97 gp10 family phage protein
MIKLKDNSKRVLTNLDKEMDKKIKDSLQVLLNDIQAKTPVDTGKFRDSIKISQNKKEGSVSTDVNYAKFVEFGTKDTQPAAMFRKGMATAKNKIKSIMDKKVTL